MKKNKKNKKKSKEMRNEKKSARNSNYIQTRLSTGATCSCQSYPHQLSFAKKFQTEGDNCKMRSKQREHWEKDPIPVTPNV